MKSKCIEPTDVAFAESWKLYVPTVGCIVKVDGRRVKLTGVKTNQDEDGNWPDDEWPKVTVTGTVVQ